MYRPNMQSCGRARPRALRARRGGLDAEMVILALLLGLVIAVAVPWVRHISARRTEPREPVAVAARTTVADRRDQAVRVLQSDSEGLSKENMAGELAQVIALIQSDLSQAEHFSLENEAVVQADFVLGDRRWSMRSFASSDANTTSSLLILSPPAESLGSWRFVAARTLDGEPAVPNFVFFPDGTIHGGEIVLGWDTLRASVRLTTAGVDGVRMMEPGAVHP